MTIEGQLNIKLTVADDHDRVEQVSIRSTRPYTLCTLFKGKTVEQCLQTVPLLYNICSNAQSYAALLSIEKALALKPDSTANNAREILLMLETVTEHCWQILLDWPLWLAAEADKTKLAEFMLFNHKIKPLLFKQGNAFSLDSIVEIQTQAVLEQVQDLQTLINSRIFNGQLARFVELESEQQLINWLQNQSSIPALLLARLYRDNWQALGQNTIALLPELNGDSLQQLPRGIEFSQWPDWQGQCYESSFLNRQLSQPLVKELYNRYGNGLISRIVARLFEIATMPEHLRQKLAEAEQGHVTGKYSAFSKGEGSAVAQVQAARGLLIHQLELKNKRIEDFQIIAPTEWNFHPAGVAAESLKQIVEKDRGVLLEKVNFLLKAIDPCVKFVINLTEETTQANNYA